MEEILLAASPILVVLVGMIGFKKPAMKVAPAAMVYTALLALATFGGTGLFLRARTQGQPSVI